jgi:hypothetical protein
VPDVPQRLLQATITLNAKAVGGGTFNDSPGNNTVTLSGLRMRAKIVHAGGPSDSVMDLDIYGMTKSQMTQLSTLGMQINGVPKNLIVLTASDSNNQSPATVFLGFIMTAYADMNAQPDVAFRIRAHCAGPAYVAQAPVFSQKGPVDVANFMSSLATIMGANFENNSISVKLPNSRFSGSPISQMKACAEAANINANVIDGTLCIWPKNGSRKSGTNPLISPSTGMIGYPAYTGLGLMVRSIFNPSVGMGQKLQVESSLQAASGSYTVYLLDIDLECNVLGGKWEMMISLYNPKYPAPLPSAKLV